MADVKLQNITKRFKYITALDNVSFNISDGEFFVLLGPTGAGKTTSLRVIAGLEKQDQGSVEFDDESVDGLSPAERDVAFVFQQYSLYPTMSVFDNLAFPLRSPMRKMPKGEVEPKVREAAEKLRISHLLDRKTAHLSGGEMQRVSIGRAIVRNPRIFLMDEPLSNLDAKLREALRVELQHIQKTDGTTTLYVTHDQVEALTMADRIAVMREGQIIQIGTPQDIYDRPATIFVAQLVGTPRINLLPASISEQKIQIASSPIQMGLNGEAAQLSSEFKLGIRPEDVVLNDNGIHEGEVMLVEPLGIETIVYIKSGEQTLLSVVSGIVNRQIGENIRFNIVQERLLFFDQNERRVAVNEHEAEQENVRKIMGIQAILFIVGFLCVLGVFIYFIRRVSARLDNKIDPRTYTLVERLIIAGIIIGIVAMFQPWIFVGYKYGFLLLLFSTLSFIVWSHVTPALTQYDG